MGLRGALGLFWAPHRASFFSTRPLFRSWKLGTERDGNEIPDGLLQHDYKWIGERSAWPLWSRLDGRLQRPSAAMRPGTTRRPQAFFSISQQRSIFAVVLPSVCANSCFGCCTSLSPFCFLRTDATDGTSFEAATVSASVSEKHLFCH